MKGVCFLLTQRRFLSRSSLLCFRANDPLCGSRKSGTSGIRLRMWQWAHLLRDGLNNKPIKSFGSGSLTSQLISQMSETRNLSHLQMMSPWINVFWSALWMSPITLYTSAWRDNTLSTPQQKIQTVMGMSFRPPTGCLSLVQTTSGLSQCLTEVKVEMLEVLIKNLTIRVSSIRGRNAQHVLCGDLQPSLC